VRRSAEGALLVREFGGDKWGWKLVLAESEHCVFFGDQETDPPLAGMADHLVSRCDVPRTGQHPPRSGCPRLSIVQIAVLPARTTSCWHLSMS
jgi:hypothetical protein